MMAIQTLVRQALTLVIGILALVMGVKQKP